MQHHEQMEGSRIGGSDGDGDGNGDGDVNEVNKKFGSRNDQTSPFQKKVQEGRPDVRYGPMVPRMKKINKKRSIRAVQRKENKRLKKAGQGGNRTLTRYREGRETGG